MTPLPASMGSAEEPPEKHVEQLILRHISDIIVAVDLARRVLYWNRAAEAMFGIPAAEAIGQHVDVLYTYEYDPPEAAQVSHQALAHGHSWHGNIIFTKRNGEQVYLTLGIALLGSVKNPYGRVAIMRDISSTKQMEKSLQTTHEAFALVTNNMSDVILRRTTAGRLIYISSSVKRQLSFTPQEILAEAATAQRHPVDQALTLTAEQLELLNQGAEELIYTVELTDRQGQALWFEVNVSPIEDEQGQRSGFVSSARNVTKRHQAEQTLRERNELLTTLSSQLVKIQEEERRRIANEIHDQLGHQLSLMGIQLQLMHNAVAQDARHDIDHYLQALEQGVETISHSTRALIDAIYPVTLDEWGLANAIRRFGHQLFVDRPLHFDVYDNDPAARLPMQIKNGLYRIAQEALANLAKHANATHASVTITRRQETYALVISDNGLGFNVAETRQAKPAQRGLSIMVERALAIGAECEIASKPGEGTVITVQGNVKELP